jgi:murein DD-endopeptidase MepM/ murein hydrolase activator NlpD
MPVIRMVPLCIALAVCLPVSAVAAPSVGQRSAAWSVQITPQRVVNGAPVLLAVTAPATLNSLSGTLLGHDLAFDHASGKHWFALAGVSLETKPGKYPLKLEGLTAKGEKIQFERTLLVSAAKYPTVKLTVSKEFTAPSPEQQEKIKADQELKHDVFSRISPEREWSGSFAPPVNAETSDPFGTRRIFNGVTKSVHQGLDYRVGPETPVSAVNRGTVILARPLYFEGNCVVIDHGQGLLSLYMHLSELKVKEGQQVERGTPIGLSGATGRATGPHLHLGVRWQGVYLNPAALLKLSLPASDSKAAYAPE